MSLDKVRKEIAKKYLGRDMLDPIKDIKTTQFISTGFPTLDTIIGGGWPRGNMTELWGNPHCGKTTLMLQTIKNCQENKLKCVYLDVERRLNLQYVNKLGVVLQDYVRVEHGEQALDIAKDYIDSGEIDLVVLDSVASIISASMAERTMEEKEQADLARLLSRCVKKLVPSLDNNNTAFVFINQIRKEVGKLYGNPEITPGGEALKFYTAARVFLRQGAFIKEKDNKIGCEVKVVVEKTDFNEPYKETTLQMIYGKGFSQLYDKFQFMLKTGEIEKSAGWFYWNKNKYQGEDKIMEAINGSK